MDKELNGEELDEALIIAWVRLTSALKNTRITKGMIYNEAIVMLIVYNRYREDGEGLVSFRELVSETKMLKSLVNRTIDSLEKKGYLLRLDGTDKRTTFVKLAKEDLGEYLAVHAQSLELAHRIREIIGTENERSFIRISEKVTKADPLHKK